MAEKGSGSGCLKAFLIVLGLLVLCTFAGGYYLYQNFGSWAGSLGATVVDQMAEGIFSDPSIPQAEREKGRKVLKDFAEKIRAGEVSVEQALAVVTQITSGPFMVAMGTQQLLIVCNSFPDFSAQERDTLAININRYAYGAISGQIPGESTQELLNLFMEVQSPAEGQSTEIKLRQDIGPEDCRRANALMDTASNEAGITTGEYELPLSEVLSAAIKRGMEHPQEVLGDDTSNALRELSGAGQ